VWLHVVVLWQFSNIRLIVTLNWMCLDLLVLGIDDMPNYVREATSARRPLFANCLFPAANGQKVANIKCIAV